MDAIKKKSWPQANNPFGKAKMHPGGESTKLLLGFFWGKEGESCMQHFFSQDETEEQRLPGKAMTILLARR
jgi:hypothetical protein